MRYDLDKFKLELPDKMKNIVKERQYKWQFCNEIIEFQGNFGFFFGQNIWKPLPWQRKDK